MVSADPRSIWKPIFRTTLKIYVCLCTLLVTMILALVVCLVSSCSRQSDHPDLLASFETLKDYANSFEGLSMHEARARLQGAELSEDDWMEQGIGGRQLTAMFTDYEIAVYFYEGEVVTTSIQVLSG